MKSIEGNFDNSKVDELLKKHFIEFKNGDAKAPLKVVGKSKGTGTQITFLPSKDIFSSIKFNSN